MDFCKLTLSQIDTAPLNPMQRLDEDEPPQSVIHIPSSFGRWQVAGNRPASLLAQSHRNRRSLSQSSTTSGSGPNGIEPPLANPISRPSTATSGTTNTTESTVPSESTLRPENEHQSADEANTVW